MSAGGDPIERYLDRLLVELRGRAPDVRRVLAEAEHHLADAVEEGLAEGLSREQAQARALDRFGTPRAVARRFSAPARLLSRTVAAQLVLSLTLLGGVGFAAVGASGAVAGVMGVVFGKSFVAGDMPGVTYTPSRCADFRRFHPDAPTCQAAATAHHFDEVVQYRLAAGVLGGLVLGGYLVVRRRWRWALRDVVLPEGFVATIGSAVFGVAGVLLVVQGLGEVAMIGRSSGGGQFLSGGMVALAVAGGFAVALLRTLGVRASQLGE